MDRRRLRLLFAAIAVGGLALDIVTKIIAVALLDPQRPVVLLNGLLTLRLIRNSGAAFSLGENFTYVFALLAAVVVVVVVVRFAPRIGHPAWAVALGLLVAGVSGNLMDRIFRAPGPLHGHVVDFLQLPYWPIFNVADMCITGAAILIMWLAIVKGIGLDGQRYAKPTTSEPVTSASAAPEPKTESTNTEPTKTEPTKTEPTRTEPTKTEPTKTTDTQ